MCVFFIEKEKVLSKFEIALLTGIFKNIFGNTWDYEYLFEANNKNYFIVIIIFFTDVSDA
jgi:hypothetical protein